MSNNEFVYLARICSRDEAETLMGIQDGDTYSELDLNKYEETILSTPIDQVSPELAESCAYFMYGEDVEEVLDNLKKLDENEESGMMSYISGKFGDTKTSMVVMSVPASVIEQAREDGKVALMEDTNGSHHMETELVQTMLVGKEFYESMARCEIGGAFIRGYLSKSRGYDNAGDDMDGNYM